MPKMIQSGAMLLTSHEVRSELSQNGYVTTAAAKTIASWYQTPSRVSQSLAAFASGSMVDLHDLHDAVLYERCALRDGAPSRYLDALLQWVEHQIHSWMA